MKEILERHAARLSPGERAAISARVLRADRAKPVFRRAWVLTTAAASLTAAAVTLSILDERPSLETLRPSGTSKAIGTALRPPIEAPTPVAPEASPGPHPEASPGLRPEAASPASPGSSSNAAPSRPIAETGPPPQAAPAPTLVIASPLPDVPVDVRAGTGTISGHVVDAKNRPVPYASVRILGLRMGALADENGAYRITGVPPAEHAIEIAALGFAKSVHPNVRVGAGESAVADAQLQEVNAQVQELSAQAAPQAVKQANSRTWGSVKSLYRGGESSSRGSEGLHLRGGRAGEVRITPDGRSGPAAPAAPPVLPITGGTRVPNDEPYDAMFFKQYGVHPFVPTDEDALSTFAVDVDAASYTVARRYLELGNLPPAEAIRVEEFVNFFRQGYPRFTDDDFRIFTDGAPSPFGAGYHLLRVGIKGREIDARDRRPARLTFVIDVSGSMEREDRLGLVKRSLAVLVDQLRDDDAIGIVVYGTNGRVLMPLTRLDDPAEPMAGRRSDDYETASIPIRQASREAVLETIASLRPEGATNAEEGLRLGYEMARSGFHRGANNRIVLCSDGVANVGNTGSSTILAQVKSDADRGIALTTIGFGMGNYNDILMEQLADAGDGSYYYVDRLDEARRVFVENLSATLQTIGRDAKVQVEFDSTRVLRYRLIGFENRDVADRDFRNDRVDAGEIGAGHEVTALYEVKLAPGVSSGTLATVRFRYAQPERVKGESPVVREISKRLDAAQLARRFDAAPAQFRFDAAVAEFAELMRGSYWARDGRIADVLPVASQAARDLRSEDAWEFVSMVQRAGELQRRSAKPPGVTEDR